ELVVELPDGEDLVDLLISEVRQVDGVAAEEIRPVSDALHDPRLDCLEAAAQLVGATDVDELLTATVIHGRRVIGASWAAVVSLEPPEGDAEGTLVADADAPDRGWLEAFLSGSRAADGSPRPADEGGTADVIWAPLPSSGLALVLGRDEMAYRARERRQVAALARVVDTRLRELIRMKSRARHPSR